MLRVLCIGDPHFQDRTRIRHEEMIEKAVALAEKLRPDRIVIMGDTLDRFKVINQYNLHNAYVFIKRLSEVACVYVLIGNHDRPTNDDFMGSIHPFEGIVLGDNEKIRIIYQTTSVYEQTLEKQLVYVPYVTNGRFQEALEYGKVELAKTAAIFAHQEFRGSNYRGIISKDGDEWSEERPFIISGHIHKYQRIGTNIVYIGTPIQFSQDEEVGKTVSLFTFEKGNSYPVEERISLGCREFKSLYTDANGFQSWEYNDLYYWLIEIKDKPGVLTIIRSSEKYKTAEKAGVSFRLLDVSTVTLEDIGTILDVQVIDLYDSILDRIKNDQLMLQWLKKSNAI